ncbi:MAG: phospho-N-acetylmuramoyl-pentapeptide-transferase [Firmicutes bacterium]|nr:phospho-N-acetylmuramoyl-pentapeptide-transferase [Bacillota bacterium]
MEPLIFPIIALISAWILGALFTKVLIPFMEKKQFRQFVREEGPKSHLKKTGTPSMGGTAIISATCIVALIVAAFAGRLNIQVIGVLAAMVLFGIIGFIDDYEKAIKKNNLGLSPKQKIVMQFVFSAAFGIFAMFFSGGDMIKGTEIWIPVFNVTFDIGVFYVPFVMFVMIAFSNSVNLTDGLDGLASGITAMVSFFVLIAGCTFGYLSIPIVFGAVAGGCLGFLMFNKNPAKIFMGDTGSMALGGVLAAGALMMKIEFLLAVAGIVYVAEALSVIIQVTYFKKTKKRIFKMAPLHHHFELCGMNEKKVVLMFWAAAFVCCVVAILLMNI